MDVSQDVSQRNPVPICSNSELRLVAAGFPWILVVNRLGFSMLFLDALVCAFDLVPCIIEGSLEVKLPTIWTYEKQRWSRRIEKRRAEERRSEKRKNQKKEDAGARKGRKVRFVSPGGRKIGSLKRQVRSQLARWEKLHAVVARSTFRSQNVQNTPGSDHFWKLRRRKAHAVMARSTFLSPMYKTPHSRTTFGSWDVEKVHAVAARSTFRRQNVKNTRGSDHYWTFRCRFAWQAQGIVHLVKSEQKRAKREGFVINVL